MNKQAMKRASIVAIAGAVALGAAAPSWAAPVLSSTTAVKEAAPSAVSDVRYRGYRGYRGGHYRNNGAGIALGVLGVAGAVAGAAAYGHGNPGYYRHGYSGGGPYDGYARGPASYGYDNNYWR